MSVLRMTVLTGVVGAMALTGCTDINTATNDPNQRLKEGAAIGAITGALIGSRRGDSPKESKQGVVMGAALGALAGGAIGNSLDKQARDLRASISNSNVQVINTGNELVVRMPQDILFPFDSADVATGLRGDLRALANNLQNYPSSTATVIGHTDNVGDASYNLDLSRRRAASVANILIGNGVAAGRIRTIGRGESEPIATNLSAAGRAQNRRVDIIIQP